MSIHQDVPVIEQSVQRPVIHQEEIITEVPIVQQQRVLEKQDIIEEQPVKVGETQTIRVTTTTVPTPVSLLHGHYEPHLRQEVHQEVLTTGSTMGTGFVEDDKDRFLGEKRELKPPEHFETLPVHHQ